MESVDNISRESLQQKVQTFLANGGEVEKVEPRNRREKRAASGKTSKRKAVKNAPARPSGKRRPILKSWDMIKVKRGTLLTCKLSDKIELETMSEVTMETEVRIKGRKPRRFLGVIASEVYIREYLKKQKKNPQGWDVFRFVETYKGKNETVHDRYLRMV